MQGLTELRLQMQDCGSCDLCRERTQVVFGEGSTEPLIMIIGEAPGKEEDIQGVPFIGEAGNKLDDILSFVGLGRDDIYITNAVLCRPPSNRNPRHEELQACKWRLDLQIQLLKPQILIALGRIAVEQLQGSRVKGALSQFFPKNPTKHGGDWRTYQVGQHSTKVLCTYHPSYLLRSPERGYKIVLPHWRMVKKWVDQKKQ